MLLNRKSVELLAPAGTWDALVAAVEAGADAVYLGGKHFNMRMRGAEFVHADKSPAADELDQVLEEMKNRGFIIGKNGVARNVMITDIKRSAVSLLAKSSGKWLFTSAFSLPP